jgi:hypothetical protein
MGSQARHIADQEKLYSAGSGNLAEERAGWREAAYFFLRCSRIWSQVSQIVNSPSAIWRYVSKICICTLLRCPRVQMPILYHCCA